MFEQGPHRQPRRDRHPRHPRLQGARRAAPSPSTREADADCLHVRFADEAVCIGPPPAAQSYLVMPALIQAALQTGAQAIHPGYGFLAERAAFSAALPRARHQVHRPVARSPSTSWATRRRRGRR